MNAPRIELSRLCDIYGALLTDKQRNALELYCNEDFSLSEIAENTGISRQGVRDQIKHAENQLIFYESVLGLSEKSRKAGLLLDELSGSYALPSNDRTAELLQELRGLFNFE